MRLRRDLRPGRPRLQVNVNLERVHGDVVGDADPLTYRRDSVGGTHDRHVAMKTTSLTVSWVSESCVANGFRGLGRHPRSQHTTSDDLFPLLPASQICVAKATNCPSSRSGYTGPVYSYQRLGATRCLGDSASVSTRFARRSRLGTGQDLTGYRGLSLPERCVGRLGRRAHTPASIHHRKPDWPNAGIRRTARSADPASELLSALLGDALWALPRAIVPARTADAPSPCATV